MSKNLDRIIVIDIEATCWENSPPPGEENEIIEIGICPVDIATGERSSKESILVKPERSRVSEFCTKLTTLTQAEVDRGISFKAACGMLKSKYLTHQRVWASYGNYDRRQFERQCQSQQISYPFNPRHINIKTLLAIVYSLPREVGMAEALEILQLPLEGTHHRGVDDAWNIAAIFSNLLLKTRNR